MSLIPSQYGNISPDAPDAIFFLSLRLLFA